MLWRLDQRVYASSPNRKFPIFAVLHHNSANTFDSLSRMRAMFSCGGIFTDYSEQEQTQLSGSLRDRMASVRHFKKYDDNLQSFCRCLTKDSLLKLSLTSCFNSSIVRHSLIESAPIKSSSSAPCFLKTAGNDTSETR